MAVDYLSAFLLAFFAAAAFAALFQAPAKSLAVSGLIGAVGWTVFVFWVKGMGYNSFYANFFATVALSLLSEIAARVFRQPATVFINPGIIPLVPGLGLYQGITKIIEKNYDAGISTLLSAGTDAGAIALGVMFMSSLFRVLKLRREKQRFKGVLRPGADTQEKGSS